MPEQQIANIVLCILSFLCVLVVAKCARVIITKIWKLLTRPFKRLSNNKHMKMGLKYEKRVTRYLKRKGFWGIKPTKASGDYGVDIIARKGVKKYAVQCKKYAGPVGIHAIQEVVAGKKHYRCNAAMVVTNSVGFTKQAQVLAKENAVVLFAGVK